MSQSLAQSEAGGNVGGSRSKKVRGKLFTRFAQLGDRARDKHAFFLAAIYYEEALRINAGHPGYWVQFGHALKESGEKGRAEDAYRSAIKLEPTNADTFLQLGHLLKIQGRSSEALEAYARASELAPGDMNIKEELGILKVIHDREEALKEEALKQEALRAARKKEEVQKAVR